MLPSRLAYTCVMEIEYYTEIQCTHSIPSDGEPIL